ncbi:MAG: DUF523 domain-containing protein [Candidatus Omnitrophota bacterium]
MILASACLAGEKCRYDGLSQPLALIVKLKEKGKVILVCPEVMGGLPVPRPPCEIIGGSGEDVINNQAKVINKLGQDVTAQLLDGAEKAKNLAQENKISLAILKSKSAACGVGKIYDGTFQQRLINGNGILTALLKNQGIRVVSEVDFFSV